MKRFFDFSFCKNITVVPGLLNLNFEMNTNFDSWGLGIIPIMVDLRYSGIKGWMAIKVGPYSFTYEVRIKMGVK